MIEIKKVDFKDRANERDFIDLLDHYASGKSGGGKPLDEEVKNTLFEKLSKVENSFSFLAYKEGRVVGLVNCFLGFSTFKGKPLINIHDIVVHESCRKEGVGKKLLLAVQEEGKKIGACKITLEVLEKNTPAIIAYKHFGFNSYELDPSMGRALFMEKEIL